MNFKSQHYLSNAKSHFYRFALVGISGIFINEGLLALFTEVFNVSVAQAGAVAIECSIVSNFFLNYWWTWQIHNHKDFLLRFLKYHAVALISAIINYAILIGLTHQDLNHHIANLIGIAAGTGINFMLNDHWTFRRQISQ